MEEAQRRTKQALTAWLAALGEHPALETYKTIKRLAGPDWGRLRPEVMAKLRKSYDKQVLAEVYLLEEEWDEAIKVAEGRDVWYPVVETVFHYSTVPVPHISNLPALDQGPIYSRCVLRQK